MGDQKPRVLALMNKVYPLKMFSDVQREALADAVPVENFPEGTVIYAIDDDAKYVNLILSGQVRLTLPVDDEDSEITEVGMGDLEMGDLFGLEALEEETEHLTGAMALTPVTVARFSYALLEDYLEENGIVFDVLMSQLSSLKLFLSVNLPWRNPNEAVIFMARRHNFFLLSHLLAPGALFIFGLAGLLVLVVMNLPGTILLSVVAGLATLAGGLWGIWNAVDWSNDYSIITNQRAVYQERVVMLYDSRQETPLEAILATSVESSQFGRILGYGNVILKTYTGNLFFQDIAIWENVRLLLDDRRARTREAAVLAEKQSLQSVVRQRLKISPPVAGSQIKPAQKLERNWTLWDTLADVFRMRSEKGGAITYRTHWFVLLGQTIVPGLTILGVVALLVLRLMGKLAFIGDLGFYPIWLILLLIVGFWLWYQYADWANDIYVVSDEQIVDIFKKPLGQEEKRVAPLKSIQSVEYERLGLIGLILNYGTVYIRIGDTRFTFDNVYNPSEVQRDLFHRIAAQTNRERRKEGEAERQRMLDVLEAYHEVMKAQQAAPPPAPPKN